MKSHVHTHLWKVLRSDPDVPLVNYRFFVGSRIPFLGEFKKTKKKKDYNKRGESKEGGEMDAILDTKVGTTVSPLLPPPPPPLPTAPPPFPNSISDGLPSPILDREILSTIPLSGEIMDDIPSNEIVCDTSSVSPSSDSEDEENVVEELPKPVLKYSYKEDQWSPLNPEGKKQYDRDFLLQLQSQPMSLCKPMNLPNVDVIKDKVQIQKLPPTMIPRIRTYKDPFMPVHARTGTGPRNPHAPANRPSQARGEEKSSKAILFPSSVNQNIKLHESQNPWKPMHKREIPSGANMEELEKENVRRSVQSVLNKLTPQNFETLLAQMKNLQLDTEEKLSLVTDLMFENAVYSLKYQVPYANLCKHLALIKVPVTGTIRIQVYFRKLLLAKCQKEFELKNDERMKSLEETDPEKNKERKLEYNEEEKNRYRLVGNIRFIGELFKLGMLVEPIMHECIKKLLSQGDDVSLECLCAFLKTIGKELDEGKAAKNSRDNQMDMYFDKMKVIVDKRLTSSRVRFMLQDVIDFKKNNWVLRRDENNPKTIDQIHKEAEREAREQQQVHQKKKNNPKRLSDDRDRRKNPGRIGQFEDGWTSSSNSNKGSYSMVDPSKLKLTKPDEVDSVRCRPRGRGLQSWGRGSSGGTKVPSDSDVKTALAKRYSALAEQLSKYEGRRGSQRSAASSRESSQERNSQLSPAIRKAPSFAKEKDDHRELQGRTRATESLESDLTQDTPSASSKNLSLRSSDYTNDDIKRKTKHLIDEFLLGIDFEEAIKCVSELISPNNVHVFITFVVDQVLERSSQDKYCVGHLLYTLLKKKIITFNQYKNGFTKILMIIEKHSSSNPLIWDHMGIILQPIIENSEFPLRLIKDVLHICIPSETAGKLVSAILHRAAKIKGTIKLGEVWRESGLQWTDFLGNDTNVGEFIKKHKLEFTVSPTKVRPKTQMSIEEIKKHLLSLLEKGEENEEIFDWIDANVSDNTDRNFIRALVTVVHEYAIIEKDSFYALDLPKLKNRVSLLTRYIDHKDRLELQALYAVQALINQLGQPSGLLHQIFDILYDDYVITEEAFKNWELSDDPNEAEGKGVAVNSVKSFFMWHREPDEADE
ncbi:eukaryotic translation initiation factor 4 gamma 3 [Trichonephila clavata]|uniref:Eukaryotic translation initiation factor 4 gamma 3 n=1 Tax=Trichonephila clavata TaxID=2740835 RepID=A0A8X6FUM7_TRICU|nr:eukaryotic translation initiation factor 4 gamma 3 [Trichonephila clavata]